jgi:hypothetical protein
VKWLPFVACYFIPRGRGFFFSLLSLSFFPWCFLPWVFSALLVLSDASPFFLFLGALYVAWVLFYVGLFSVRFFFFFFPLSAQSQFSLVPSVRKAKKWLPSHTTQALPE